MRERFICNGTRTNHGFHTYEALAVSGRCTSCLWRQRVLVQRRDTEHAPRSHNGALRVFRAPRTIEMNEDTKEAQQTRHIGSVPPVCSQASHCRARGRDSTHRRAPQHYRAPATRVHGSSGGDGGVGGGGVRFLSTRLLKRWGGYAAALLASSTPQLLLRSHGPGTLQRAEGHDTRRRGALAEEGETVFAHDHHTIRRAAHLTLQRRLYRHVMHPVLCSARCSAQVWGRGKAGTSAGRGKGRVERGH